LDQSTHPEVAAAFQHPEFGPALKSEDKRALQNYVGYLKAKRKKEADQETKR
jgi:hypothetical protein